jgi:hypothetical protein
MSRYWQSFSALPRAAKWALTGLVVVALYFLVIERMMDLINVINGKADISANTLSKFAASSEPQKHALETLKLGFRTFGDVDFPADQAARTGAFNSTVDRILKEQRVSNAKSRTKNAPLGQGPLANKLGSDQRVERVVRDIEFDATPEAITQVIADLERSPVVATVSKVQIRSVDTKDKSSRQLHAALTAEAWVLGLKKGA